METPKTYTLVASLNRGRFALDTPDGRDVTSGMKVAIELGGQWIEGRIEYADVVYPVEDSYSVLDIQGGYIFIARPDRSVCGLCIGMAVRKLEG